jgi:hypothetical protein
MFFFLTLFTCRVVSRALQSVLPTQKCEQFSDGREEHGWSVNENTVRRFLDSAERK